MHAFGSGHSWLRGLGLGFTNPVGTGGVLFCGCSWAVVVWVV